MTMPHVNSGGSDDIYNSDEVKVYRHEGDEENEKNSSEILSEDKLGLVTETEEAKGGYAGNPKDPRLAEEGKAPSEGRDVPFGYYPHYPNGSTPTSMGGKVPMLQSPLGVMMGYGNDGPFTSPPPAHMGIPPVTIDPKTGLPRPTFPYTAAPGQFPPSLYPDVQSWQRPGYPISSGALGGHYPPSFSSARYPPGLFPPGMAPGMPHMGAGPKQEGGVSDNHRHGYDGGGNQSPQPEKKKPHIKKPLNAFMLFMKEQRAKVVAECTLKESAAINQILGRRWHALDRSEQAKYYEMARKEKELHLQLYPGWSARDNYAVHAKKKKRKKDVMPGEKGPRPDDRFMDNPAFALPLVIGLLISSIDFPEEDHLTALATYIIGAYGIKQPLQWHSLNKEDQTKYYEMARKEKELHLQLHPGWSARDNYGAHIKKKKRKRDDVPESSNPLPGECTSNAKKCRARYGMDQQKNWCKPCRTDQSSEQNIDIKIPKSENEEEEKMH